MSLDDADKRAVENIKSTYEWKNLPNELKTALHGVVSGICGSSLLPETTTRQLTQKFYEAAGEILNKDPEGQHFNEKDSYLMEVTKSVGRQAMNYKKDKNKNTIEVQNRIRDL